MGLDSFSSDNNLPYHSEISSAVEEKLDILHQLNGQLIPVSNGLQMAATIYSVGIGLPKQVITIGLWNEDDNPLGFAQVDLDFEAAEAAMTCQQPFPVNDSEAELFQTLAELTMNTLRSPAIYAVTVSGKPRLGQLMLSTMMLILQNIGIRNLKIYNDTTRKDEVSFHSREDGVAIRRNSSFYNKYTNALSPVSQSAYATNYNCFVLPTQISSYQQQLILNALADAY